MSVEHARLAVEALRGLFHHGGFGRSEVQDLLDQPLEGQWLARLLAPVLQLPALPADDVGAGARVARPERVRLLVGEMVHDRGRFPEHEIAVYEGGRASGRVESEIFRRALLPLAEIDQRKLEREADMGGDGAHLPGIGRWGKAVELHGRLLSRLTM